MDGYKQLKQAMVKDGSFGQALRDEYAKILKQQRRKLKNERDIAWFESFKQAA